MSGIDKGNRWMRQSHTSPGMIDSWLFSCRRHGRRVVSFGTTDHQRSTDGCLWTCSRGAPGVLRYCHLPWLALSATTLPLLLCSCCLCRTRTPCLPPKPMHTLILLSQYSADLQLLISLSIWTILERIINRKGYPIGRRFNPNKVRVYLFQRIFHSIIFIQRETFSLFSKQNGLRKNVVLAWKFIISMRQLRQTYPSLTGSYTSGPFNNVYVLWFQQRCCGGACRGWRLP